MNASVPKDANNSAERRDRLIALALAAGILLVFAGASRHPFIELDDDLYVSQNSHVLQGLTFDSIRYAFTSTEIGHWHPLTFLSHMLDVQVYGLNAGGHHLTSVLLHIVDTILLFYALRRMTGACWRSALVAALFALHPLHVEPVASVSCRKDTLSALFWMLTFLAYHCYTETRTLKQYLLVVAAVAMAMMSKPISVTLPFVLLLLDVWPLRRISMLAAPEQTGSVSLGRVAIEKIPLAAMSAASCAVTYFAAQTSGVLPTVGQVSLASRFANAFVAHAAYLGQTFWPTNLAAFYPVSMTPAPVWEVAVAVLLVLVISLLALWQIRRRPYLAVGWFWFLGVLLPVSGIVQIGLHVRADRYTYLALIGPFMALVWGAGEFVTYAKLKTNLVAALACALLAVLSVVSWVQVGHWRSSMEVWSHALETTTGNFMAHNNLGVALVAQRKFPEASGHFEEAIQIYPEFVKPYYNLGLAFYHQGWYEEALQQFLDASRRDPSDGDTQNWLGVTYAKQGNPGEAEAHYLKSIELQPGRVRARVNLGALYASEGKTADARRCYEQALAIDSRDAEAHVNLGNLCAREKKYDEALQHFSLAVRLQPRNLLAHYNLGAVYELKAQYSEALAQFQEALKIDPSFDAANQGVARVQGKR